MADTGTGIRAGHVEANFEDFPQLDRSGEGTCLTLDLPADIDVPSGQRASV